MSDRESSMTSARSNIEWRAYGALDYGVSHDFAHGIREWHELKEVLKQYHFTQFETCLEIGCGAGRLTNALAGDFQKVYAIDVSPDRIRQVSEVPNASRVYPLLIDHPTLPVESSSVDLCISTHVFQHISQASVVHKYLEETFRVLCPGGCILIHLPVVGAHGFRGTLASVARRRTKALVKSMIFVVIRPLITIGVKGLLKMDHYTIFDYTEVYRQLQKIGFADIEMRFLARDRIHSYVFARKPA